MTIEEPEFPDLIRRFLYDQLYPDCPLTSANVPLTSCPELTTNQILIYNSAVAIFYAPSDHSGLEGMRREHIRATSSWRQSQPRYDCVLVNSDPEQQGFRGLDVAQVRLFFSFEFRRITYRCALTHWFCRIGNGPDEDTGMWMVEPEVGNNGERLCSVIHIDCIVRAAHLIPVYGDAPIPRSIDCNTSLHAFRAYYVNKFIDHQAFQMVS
jgi:hypothetical protein